MNNNIYKHRGGLKRTLCKIREANLTIGFIGGSITEQKVWCNWPEPVINWFVEKFPDVRITVENAAIAATGSDLAVFRAKRDLIDRNCDLVFIEYAVNDFLIPPERRMRTREGLIRKLLTGEGRDLVLVYTHGREMVEDYAKGTVPATIAELEQLAGHYGIGSVWMGLYAYHEVKKGRLRWEEWLPDGLHPSGRGSLSYGTSVIEFLEKELCGATVEEECSTEINMPAPLNIQNWESAYLLPFSEVKFQGPFKIRRWTENAFMDQAIETSAVGAKLFLTFEGRGLTLGFDFGKLSSEFRYRIDNEEWVEVVRDRPEWCAESGWFKVYNISDDLPAGKHEFELEVTHGARPECKGTRFCLGFIGVIK